MGRSKARVRKRAFNRGSLRTNVQSDSSRMHSGIGHINNIPADPPALRRAAPVSGTISFYLRQYDGWTNELPPIAQQFDFGTFHRPGYIVVKPQDSGHQALVGLFAGYIEGMIFSQLLGIHASCVSLEGFAYMIHKISIWGGLNTTDVGLTLDKFLTGSRTAPVATYDNAAKNHWPRVSWTNPVAIWTTNAKEVTEILASVLVNMPAYQFNPPDLWNVTNPVEETQLLCRMSVTCTTSGASYTKECGSPGKSKTLKQYLDTNALGSEEDLAVYQDPRSCRGSC